jgi:hypothetical protein
MDQTRNCGAPECFGEPLQTLTRTLGCADPARIRALVQRLGELGLNERAVRACFGVRCVGHAAIGRRLPADQAPWPPAAVLPRMFVARHAVPAAVARRRLADSLDELSSLGLVTCEEQTVCARVTLLPVGEAIAVCGPPPDDSTFHLIGTLPTRKVPAWLDVGTGNAIVPLARRGLATRVLASDTDHEAIGFARAGINLSGATEIEPSCASLLDGASGEKHWPLITFNAPIPTAAEPDLLDRFWQQARTAIDDCGEVILHAQQPHRDYPDRLDLPGCTVAARYTPDGVEPAFGVTIWRPSGRERRALVHTTLTREHPHLRRADFGLDA